MLITDCLSSMTVNLGPVFPTLDGVVANGDGFSYNPRCLRRDISQWIAQNATTTPDIVSLIEEPDNVYDFQNMMQGLPFSSLVGVHIGGHFTISGDPGGVSPSFSWSSDILLSQVRHLTNHIISTGRLCLPRRPSLLAPSRPNRSRLVDLAEPRSGEPSRCHCWWDEYRLDSLDKERDLGGSDGYWIQCSCVTVGRSVGYVHGAILL